MSVRPLSTGIKCLELLEVLSEQPGAVRLADVTRLIGESRATTYQRLATLVAAGWAETTEDGRYRLSPRALRIGSAALEQAGLGERALPVLNRLTEQTQETSSLVLTEGSRIIIAQRVEARGVLRADLRVGAELSFKESASGMVWGAFGPDSLRDLLHTSGVRTASDTRLRDVRRNGYAVSGGGETLQGIAVVAVPVLDPNGRCVASMSLVGPEQWFDVDAVLPPLQAAAAELAATL